MRFKSSLVLVLALSALIVASCSNQQAVTQPTPTKEVTVTSTANVVPTETPTMEPTPTEGSKIIAEDFEDCKVIDYVSVMNEDTVWDWRNLKLSYEGSNIIVENKSDGTRIVIGESEVSNGIATFTINETKVAVTSGTIVVLNVYAQGSRERLGAIDTESMIIFSYSPDLNQFVEDAVSTKSTSIPLPIQIDIFNDSVVSVPSYMEGFCLGIAEDFLDYTDKFLHKKSCVVSRLSNGDEYGWGVNKYGDIVCPSISIVEQ